MHAHCLTKYQLQDGLNRSGERACGGVPFGHFVFQMGNKQMTRLQTFWNRVEGHMQHAPWYRSQR